MQTLAAGLDISEKLTTFVMSVGSRGTGRLADKNRLNSSEGATTVSSFKQKSVGWEPGNRQADKDRLNSSEGATTVSFLIFFTCPI